MQNAELFFQIMHHFSLKTNIMHYELCIQHYSNLSLRWSDKLEFELQVDKDGVCFIINTGGMFTKV